MKAFAHTLIFILVAAAAFAAHPFRVEDMQSRLSRLGGARISPDGKWVAFTVARSDVPKNRMVTNIWMVPQAGGVPQQLTFADKGANSELRWSPDSEALYFVSTRVDGKPQLFRLARRAAKRSPSARADRRRHISCRPTAGPSSYVPALSRMLRLPATRRRPSGEEDTVKARVITEIPFRRWDSWVDGSATTSS